MTKLSIERSPVRGRVATATLLAVAFAFAILAAACGGDDEEPAAPAAEEAPAEEKEVRIALLIPIQANAYTGAYQDGVRQAAAEQNATVRIFDSFFDPQKQVAQCQDVVSGRTADAMIIHPVVGPSVVPCVKRAIETGIEVVALDGPIGPRYDTAEPQVEGLAGSVVQTTSGEPPVVARALILACEDKDPCNVGRLLGVAGFSYDSERTKVIKSEIEDHPNIKIVQEVVYGFDPRKAQSATREMLTAHPEINVIESNGGQGALVALAVAEQMGLDVIAIAQSGSAEEIEAVKNGELFATVATFTQDMGRRAAEIALAAARGEPEEDPFVDVRVDLGPEDLLITRDNADEFEAQWELGPLPTG